jgi:hypothetical protein
MEMGEQYTYSGEHIVDPDHHKGYEIGIIGTYKNTGMVCWRWRSHVSREVYDRWANE